MKLFALVLSTGLLAIAIQSNVSNADTNLKSPKVTQSEKEIIATDAAPKAVGPYSQAVKKGNTLYLSGQIAINPETGKMNHGSIEEQTRQVLNNIQMVLQAAGFKLSDVVQSQVFLKDLNHYKAMNRVYAEYFSKGPPARAAIEVSRLPLDASVEIMVTAVK